MVQQYGEKKSIWDTFKDSFLAHQVGKQGGKVNPGGNVVQGTLWQNRIAQPRLNTNAPKQRSGYSPGYKPGIYKPKSDAPKSPYSDGWKPGLYETQGSNEMPWSPPSMPSGDFTSFLSQAQGLVGDGGMAEALALFDNQKKDTERRAQEADSRLASMYDVLRQSILDDRGAIDASANTAREALTSSGSAAQEAIKSGYETTQKAQNDILERLGIGDAAITLQNKGDIAGQAMQQAVDDAASRTQANNDLVTNKQQNANELIVTNSQAAGLEGADRRATLQSDLQSALARLADQRTAAQADYSARNQAAALQLAQQLYGDQMNRWQNQYGMYMDEQNLMRGDSDRAWGRQMDMEGLQSQIMQAQAKANQGPSWDHLNSPQKFAEQFTNQIGGPATNQAISALTAAAQNGILTRKKAAEQLMASGITDPNVINMLISEYGRAYGIKIQ